MAWAQKFIVKAPSHVPAGETFRLEYTIHTTNVRGGLRLGNIPNGLEVVFGPSESRMESFSTTNGHTSSSSVTTITYMLVGNANGTYTIPPARIDAGGRTITSPAVRVTISGASRQNKKGGTKFYEEEQEAAHPRTAGSPITDRDLFIKVSANKNRVYEQEPVLLTYKVYTLVDLTQLEGSMPDLNGFHSQALPLPQQKNFTIEQVNGRNYRCTTCSRYIMYPQMTGKLDIPSITFKGIVVQENRNVDPYEAFLCGVFECSRHRRGGRDRGTVQTFEGKRLRHNPGILFFEAAVCRTIFRNDRKRGEKEMLTIENLKEFGANVEEGAARCMGLNDFYLKLVNMAVPDEQLNALEASLAKKDLDTAFEIAHALKGMYGNISLTPIYKPLSEMTELLRSRTDTDYSALLAEAKTQKKKLEELAK